MTPLRTINHKKKNAELFLVIDMSKSYTTLQVKRAALVTWILRRQHILHLTNIEPPLLSTVSFIIFFIFPAKKIAIFLIYLFLAFSNFSEGFVWIVTPGLASERVFSLWTICKKKFQYLHATIAVYQWWVVSNTFIDIKLVAFISYILSQQILLINVNKIVIKNKRLFYRAYNFNHLG
jgi:hypothetical protein